MTITHVAYRSPVVSGGRVNRLFIERACDSSRAPAAILLSLLYQTISDANYLDYLINVYF